MIDFETLLRFAAKHVSMPPRRNKLLYVVYDYGGVVHATPQLDVIPTPKQIAESDQWLAVYRHAVVKRNNLLVAWLYDRPPRGALSLLVPRPWCFMRFCGAEKDYVCETADGLVRTAWGGWWFAVSYPPALLQRRQRFPTLNVWR